MPWVAHDLGFQIGGSYSIALATTADDDVLVIVGQGDTASSSFESHGFWWTEATGMIDLGVLAGGTFSIATGVSADGTKVSGQGDAFDGLIHPILWEMDIDGTILNMTALPFVLGGERGVAYGVSADGTTVVGYSDIDPFPTPNHDPTIWAPGLDDIGVCPGNTEGIALAASADGSTIVGGTNQLTAIPWIFTLITGSIPMPLASGEGQGEARAVSGDGLAATGWNTTTPGAAQHAFLWTSAGGTDLIGAFPGADFSVGNGISTFGTFIVGDSATTGNHRAFLWDVTDAPGDFEELFPLFGGGSAVARAISGVNIDNDMVIAGECIVAGERHAIYWTFAPGAYPVSTIIGKRTA